MNRQRIIRVAAIVAVAGATGFVMQSQDKAQQRIAAVVEPPAGPAIVPQAAAALPPTLVAAPPRHGCDGRHRGGGGRAGTGARTRRAAPRYGQARLFR
ncbi:hypothetical protein [Gemmobacter sp.]|uniref:hypothetical protein n=1 Tax=Gemmobacter sp. TaxID=1898957 RepID=UPI002AFE9EF6|nr:hypothetical protein [Gemmobacter sp.]